MEHVSHHGASAAVASMHECPDCKKVGRVYRSWPRSFPERIAVRLIPMYGIYRCHECDWRGWQIRSGASPVVARILLVIYVLLLLAAIGGGVMMMRRMVPHPQPMP